MNFIIRIRAPNRNMKIVKNGALGAVTAIEAGFGVLETLRRSKSLVKAHMAMCFWQGKRVHRRVKNRFMRLNQLRNLNRLRSSKLSLTKAKF